MIDGGIIKGLLGLLVHRINCALAIGGGPSSFSVVWKTSVLEEKKPEPDPVIMWSRTTRRVASLNVEQ